MKIRYEPKSFKWWSPDPTARGGSRWGKSDGVTLYRLPELIDAVLVVVVEGEKSADRLISLGFAATCPPSGASVWNEAYSEAVWRAGAHAAAVIGDHDRSGKRHALRVVRALRGFRPATISSIPETDEPWAAWPCAHATDPDVQPLRASLVALPNLPYRGDVCDWLDAGHHADELRALILAARDFGEIEQAKTDRVRELARQRQRRHRAKLRRSVA